MQVEESLRSPSNGVSHVVGLTSPPLSELTISNWLDATAASWPEREACVFYDSGVRWTWAQLRDESNKLAAALLHLGFVTGERVGIWSPNRSEWILAQYATARIGVVLVNINPAYRLAELEYALNKVQCKGLISAPSFKTSNYLGMLQSLAPELAQCKAGELQAQRLPHLRCVIRMDSKPPENTPRMSPENTPGMSPENTPGMSPENTPGMLNWQQVMAMADAPGVLKAHEIGRTLDRHDAVNVQFTSGTTGHPKGATLTHRNIVNNALAVAAAMGFTADDKLCIPVPLYHCFGMVMGSLVCTVTGGTMVFPGEGFDALTTLQALQAERCTALHGVPTMFIAELDHPDFASFDLTSLRKGCMAGSPCPVEVMKRVVTDMHMSEVTIAYGMTETSPVSFQSAPTDPLDKRVSTVGRVMPHLEVKVIDAAGAIVPTGQTGELCTRGYSVMRGYWGDTEKTSEAVRDGWMHTGDLATIDEAGYCNIVGRVKDMLIRGGENVYPREVEEFLFKHPAIAQAQVFGVPDAKYGEEVCAWVVLKPNAAVTESELRLFCQDQIAHYKVPRYFRFVSEIPMTVTGKAQKFVMRQAMQEEMGLG